MNFYLGVVSDPVRIGPGHNQNIIKDWKKEKTEKEGIAVS
jgi:hypothetical protein